MSHHPIPNSLRLHRGKAGLRQVDVAEHLGLASTDRISHWEKGQTFPHILNLFKLARLYGVLPHELYEELWEASDCRSITEGSIPVRDQTDLPQTANFTV